MSCIDFDCGHDLQDLDIFGTLSASLKISLIRHNYAASLLLNRNLLVRVLKSHNDPEATASVYEVQIRLRLNPSVFRERFRPSRCSH